MKRVEELEFPLKEKNINTTLKRSYMMALENNNFVKLVNSLDVSEDVLIKYTSKLERSVEEINNCKGCKGLSYCKNKVRGYINYPIKENESLVFVYRPCKYEKINLKQITNVIYFETPKFLREAQLSDIYAEKERIQIIKYIKDFINKYDKENIKGLYLHGSFGSGKSYILNALFNEMSKKGYRCVSVYYPSLLRSLKEAFDENFDEKMKEIITCDILLLDDMGAENNTPWARDEILGTILQYRMDNNLATFFTSNLSLKELEEHLKSTKNSVDSIKARRIIERIKQLTIEMELVSENKRK